MKIITFLSFILIIPVLSNCNREYRNTLEETKLRDEQNIVRSHTIDQTIAIEYMDKYREFFQSNEFPTNFVIKKSVFNQIQKINVKKNDIKFILSEKNGTLTILYYDIQQNRKYFVNNLDKIVDVTNQFHIYDFNFKNNLYEKMNANFQKLRNVNYKVYNTTSIMIPYEVFDSFNNNTNNSQIVINLGIINRDEVREGKSVKYQITLIMSFFQYNNSKKSEKIYYDTFCLDPPGCN